MGRRKERTEKYSSKKLIAKTCSGKILFKKGKLKSNAIKGSTKDFLILSSEENTYF